MKIERLHLHPFAAFRDREFNFNSGLNVILGPNEAGKSTMLNAIDCALAQETVLTKNQVSKDMGRFFPIDGSDVIRISIDFSCGDSEYNLKKRWQLAEKKGSASLFLPDGSEITEPEEIQNRIENLLPVRKGTFRHILLTFQNELTRTLQSMKNSNDPTRQDLNNLLRSSIMNTDGVSVDEFVRHLNEKVDQYMGRWDTDSGGPEKGRGINNPWKMGAGYVVEAYYAKERARQQAGEAEEIEKNIQDLDQEINDLTERYEVLQPELAEYEEIEPGIRQRSELEHKVQQWDTEIKKLQDVNRRWPVVEHQLKEQSESLDEQQHKLERVEKELSNARAWEKQKSTVEQLRKADDLYKKIENQKKEISETQKVSWEQVKRLRELENQINKLNATISASKLTVRIDSEGSHILTLKDAYGNSDRLELEEDSIERRTFEGAFSLSGEGLKVTVQAGEGELIKTIRQKDELNKEVDELKTDIDVKDSREAESCFQLYRDKKRTLDDLQQQFTELLNGTTYEDLQKTVNQQTAEEPERPVDHIAEERARLESEIKQLKKQIKDNNEQLETWKSEYGSVDDLLMHLSERSSKKKEAMNKLEELPSLPEGIEDTEEFYTKLKSIRNQLEGVRNELHQKENEKGRLEEKLMGYEWSVDELKEEYKEQEERFQRFKQEGEALVRVQRRTHKVLADMDQNTFDEYNSYLYSYLAKLTGNRYERAEMTEGLPDSIYSNNSDKKLSLNRLSFGTMDTLALALRLTMADYFLQNTDGFLVLDDPMVDMDPERQKRAADQILQSAENRQILYFTCHPHMADLLQGAQIKLDHS